MHITSVAHGTTVAPWPRIAAVIQIVWRRPRPLGSAAAVRVAVVVTPETLASVVRPAFKVVAPLIRIASIT